MDSYLSIPIINEFITRVSVDDQSNYENNVKAMLSGVLSHEFPLSMGYVLVPGQNRNASYPGFTGYHKPWKIQRHVPGDREFVDHLLVEVMGPDELLADTTDQLLTALESANTQHGRCWAIIAIGPTIEFYEYHGSLPVNHQLIPWYPPGRSTNNFNISIESVVLQSIFDHMRRNNEPAAR
ncbi:hypothetical protein N7466_009666 [Penicillium verhagenii]|uniref:uncharacterized protein n=1 Tax=Penicillium verhagenii TaxID=1562060 RepID=UPI0025456965|nr:uncharacterized protein N7466_009666 [Penicillium verhagenii]KAJ5921340.1 hypothetical protein N7466_009666 [Penicillium verhagenii]